MKGLETIKIENAEAAKESESKFRRAVREREEQDLRDVFAGLAMQALLSALEDKVLRGGEGYGISKMAESAYAVADEMMHVRAKK